MNEGNPLIDKRQTYKSMSKIVLICLNIALSSFYFGYVIVYAGTIPIKTIIQNLYPVDLSQSSASGIINGAVSVGALFGALSSSVLLTKFSRRKCLLLINVIALIAGALIFIPNFYSLIIFRIFQGFCVGSFSAIAPLIIKQLAPTQISGTLGSLTQLNVSIGIFFGSILTYILKKVTGDDTCQKFWFICFGFTQLTVLLQTLLLVFVYPYETPKYLLSKGQQAQARKLVQLIYKQQYVQQIMQEKQADLSSSATLRTHQQQSVVSETPAQTNVRDTKVAIIISLHLAIMQQLSGINAVVLYGSDIAKKSLSGQMASILPSLINLLQVLCTFFTSILLSKFGRKTILVIGALLEGVATAIVMIGFFLNEGQESQVAQALIIVGLFLFVAIFGLSLGPVVFLYIPQIVQPKIVPYSTASNWISCLLVVIFFPILTDMLPNQNPAPLFIFFTIWCIGSSVFNWFFMLETKDKSQKLIREEYARLKICN